METAHSGQMSVRTARRDVVVTLDAQHLQAHADDFLIPLDEVIRIVVNALDQGKVGSVSATLDLGRPAGVSRLVQLGGDDHAYWGVRPGRALPSHLIDCAPRPTTLITAWGTWTDRDRLNLETVFPGPSAPREIHDPELPLDEIDASIAFWMRHALARK